MGIHLSLVNFTRLIASSETDPIIINDLHTATEEDKRVLDNLISVRYENTDLFSNEPSCECGFTKGGYRLGVTCPNCRMPVRELFDQALKPLVWLRSPNGVEPLFNPMVWTMLSEKFVKGNGSFNLIEWLCNTDYQPTAERPPEVDELLELGVERGYNNFVKNFDLYIDILFSLKQFKPKKGKDEHLRELLTKQRDCVFSQFLPVPNKALMIIENTQVGVFIDPIIVGALDAIRTISSIDTPLSNFTVRQKENRTAKTLVMLANYYNQVYHEILASKNGMFRKHVFGTRAHFTVRAVISSNTRVHRYDSLEIGWGHAVTVLKIHLTNKLLRMGMTPRQCTLFLQEYTSKYHPVLDALFMEIIAETPGGKGLPCTFGRNPSLTRASVQRMFITRVKPDPNDPTITLSILAVKGYNADFDGDQMNLMLVNDNTTAEQLIHLAPHKNSLNPNKVRSLTSASSFPKPVASTVANWLNWPRQLSGDPVKRAFLESLAE